MIKEIINEIKDLIKDTENRLIRNFQVKNILENELFRTDEFDNEYERKHQRIARINKDIEHLEQLMYWYQKKLKDYKQLTA